MWYKRVCVCFYFIYLLLFFWTFLSKDTQLSVQLVNTSAPFLMFVFTVEYWDDTDGDMSDIW